MQDNYVGDIGDYGKYGLLRAITAAGMRLAVNWYRVVPKAPGKQDDGKYISYLVKPQEYRHYDPELFDCLADLVKRDRSVEAVEKSGIFEAQFFGIPLTGTRRKAWHEQALLKTVGADVVFLDPDNGLETEKMHQRGSAKDKHTTWQEVKDYYDRGQSVILYQHRPQMMKREPCIRKILAFQTAFLRADKTLLLEYPRYTNRYYFMFVHAEHQAAMEAVYHSVVQTWNGLCCPVDLCRLPGDQ